MESNNNIKLDEIEDDKINQEVRRKNKCLTICLIILIIMILPYAIILLAFF
ncbi:MAG: hypothetical protein ACFFA0_04515 [Promethearchaeota archaeon]